MDAEKIAYMSVAEQASLIASGKLSPVDLVIDHSVMVDRFASLTALRDNTAIEMERNGER